MNCPYCYLDTAGHHQPSCPYWKPFYSVEKDIAQLPAPLGWICPVCGKGMSPFVTECDCVHPAQLSILESNSSVG